MDKKVIYNLPRNILLEGFVDILKPNYLAKDGVIKPAIELRDDMGCLIRYIAPMDDLPGPPMGHFTAIDISIYKQSIWTRLDGIHPDWNVIRNCEVDHARVKVEIELESSGDVRLWSGQMIRVAILEQLNKVEYIK